MDNKRLIHDLSKYDDINHFVEMYGVHYLREHLEDLVENREYLYEPARRLLIALNKLKPLPENLYSVI